MATNSHPKRVRDDVDDSARPEKRTRRHTEALPEIPGTGSSVRTHDNVEGESGPDQRVELEHLRRQNALLQTQNLEMQVSIAVWKQRIIDLETRLTRIEVSMQEAAQQGPITTVPHEIIYEIFRFLPLPDLLQCERVCTAWHENLIMWLMELDLSPYSDIVTNGLLQHVSKYRNLQSLDLAHYKEIVDPALCLIAASFPNLRHLDIFGLNLDELKALDKLVSLTIGDCDQIEDKHLALLPPQICSLHLEWLSGVKNEGLANLAHMTNLADLTIEQNDNMTWRSMVLPDALVPSLKKFRVFRQGNFSDVCLSTLSRFSNLEKLSLYWVPIVGHGFAAMQNKMPALKKLVLRRGFSTLTKSLKHLTSLQIAGPSNMRSESLRSLTELTSLRELRIVFASAEFDFLANMQLTRLDVIGSSYLASGVIAKIVSTQFSTLERLTIDYRHFRSSADFVELKRLKRLRSLQITGERMIWPNGELFTFVMLPEGGVDFEEWPVHQPMVIEIEDDDDF